MNSEFIALLQAIDNSHSISLVSHINPDGDNLGSMLGFGLSLIKYGKNVDLVKPDLIPDDYRFLPGILHLSGYGEVRDPMDLLIVLDSSDPSRLGENRHLLDLAKQVVNIDHHVSNSLFGDIKIVASEASSTGEIIYQIIEQLGFPLDKDIAACIYTAISTDTGRFSYQSVTSETHRIAAKLYEQGINGYEINKNLYQMRSLKKTKLFALGLSEMKLLFEGRLAIIGITQSMLAHTGAKIDDTEGIVEFLRDTDTVEAACLLKEMPENIFKVSIRTKNILDANYICAIFGGGGHVRASGCTLQAESLDEAEKMIIEEIAKLL